MLWQFIQLFPLDVVDEFSGPGSIPMPLVTQVFSVIRFFKSVLFGLFDWGDLLFFFAAIAVVFFSFIYTVFTYIFSKVAKERKRSIRPLQVTIFDVFYIVLLDAILNIFSCTYSCKYDPNNPPEAPYPPYSLYTDINCASTQHILLFSVGLFALLYYHWRASHFIVKEEGKDSDTDEEGDDNEPALPDKFRYAECILRVCFSLFWYTHPSLYLSNVSSMYLFHPYFSPHIHYYS